MLTDELQSYRESDDYTEIDINKWTQKLQALRKMLESPPNICIDENETSKSIIHLIRLRDQQKHRSPNFAVKSLQHRISAIEKSRSSSNERFDEIFGPAIITEGGLVVTCCSDSIFSYSIIYGADRYSSGTHRIHFRIDKIGDLRLFFGITASSVKMTRASTRDKSLYGWCDLNKVVENGERQKSADSKVIRMGDEVTLTLDCDNRQIRLQHHRTNRLLQLYIDINNCPFPWKTVVELPSEGDSVRILQ
jgi:hypothetical protein